MLVCHYWTNVEDALWLATRPGVSPFGGHALQFWAQVPSYEIHSTCMEDVDYCWGKSDPNRRIMRERRRRTAVELEGFLNVAKMLCRRTERSTTRCFVIGALPSEKKFSRVMKSVWERSGVVDEFVHLIDPARVFASRPFELVQGYLMSSFAAQWTLQMVLNTACHDAPESDTSVKKLFTFDDACHGLPLIDDDQTRCSPLVVKHRTLPLLLAQRTKTTHKESTCKVLRDSCVLSTI